MQVGEIFADRYRIESQIAHGGQGQVVLATELSSGLKCAIKTTSADPFDTGRMPCLHQEAQTVASLNHPGVVRVHATGKTDGLKWFAMDYVAGQPALVWAKAAQPTHWVWLAIAAQVLEVLDHAHGRTVHRRGVLHRDLKSSNVLVEGGLRPIVRVVDWGVACDASTKRRTKSDVVVGTTGNIDPAVLAGGEWSPQSHALAHGMPSFALNYAPSQAPNARQRGIVSERASKEGIKGDDFRRVAMVTDSVLTRGAVTALGWVMKVNKVQIRSFGSLDYRKAVDWIVMGETGYDVEQLVGSIQELAVYTGHPPLL